MSTLFVAVTVVSAVVITVLLIISHEKRKKRAHLNQFINRFMALGSLHNLNFSSQEMLKDAAIGLDGRHRKLLILIGKHESAFNHHLFHLNDLKSCTVREHYGIYNSSSLKNKLSERYLEKLMLRFEMKAVQDPVEVDFYNHVTNSVYEIKERTERAKHWETILSKMLKSPLKEVAW